MVDECVHGREEGRACGGFVDVEPLISHGIISLFAQHVFWTTSQIEHLGMQHDDLRKDRCDRPPPLLCGGA